jgi:GNAT superfamily N-acetyltransferase
VSWRVATLDDAVVLRDLEREANLVGLAHVFPGRPFPDEEVLARWRATLAEPGVTVMLTDAAFTSWDDTGRLRHLAVHPDRWGTGLARDGVALAVEAIRGMGLTPRLWVLVANERARGLYTHLGWVQTGRRQAAEWPPYPPELELVLEPGVGPGLPESAHGR